VFMKYVGSLHALASCDTCLRRACRPSQPWSRKVLQVGDITPSGTDAPTRITACHRSADNRSALNSARRAQSQPPHGPPNPAPVLTRQPTARHWVAPGEEDGGRDRGIARQVGGALLELGVPFASRDRCFFSQRPSMHQSSSKVWFRPANGSRAPMAHFTRLAIGQRCHPVLRRGTTAPAPQRFCA